MTETAVIVSFILKFTPEAVQLSGFSFSTSYSLDMRAQISADWATAVPLGPQRGHRALSGAPHGKRALCRGRAALGWKMVLPGAVLPAAAALPPPSFSQALLFRNSPFARLIM